MGQGDQSAVRYKQPAKCNVQQHYQYVNMIISPSVRVPFAEKVFSYENYELIEVIYKFFTNVFINLQLSKEKSRKQKGVEIKLAKDYVYGYKYKKNDKIQKIRPQRIFFRKRMYISSSFLKKSKEESKKIIKLKSISMDNDSTDNNQKFKKDENQKIIKSLAELYVQEINLLIRKFAQLKMMSLMDLGPKLGRMTDGSDGFLTQHYIEYYSEITIQMPSLSKRQKNQKLTVKDNLLKKGFQLERPIDELSIMYSVFQRGYLIHQQKYLQHKPNLYPQEQLIDDNRSIKFVIRQFQEEIQRCIGVLDANTKMLSAINNHLTQRDVEKARQKYDQNILALSEQQKLQYAEQVSIMLSRFPYYKNFEKHVNQFLSSSHLSSSRQANSVSRSQSIEMQMRRRSQQSSSEQNQRQQDVSEVHIQASNSVIFNNFNRKPTQQIEQAQISEEPLASYECLFVPINKSQKFIKQSKIMKYFQLRQHLATYILDSNKAKINETIESMKLLNLVSQIQVQIEFGKCLMENGHSRHAAVLFQRLTYLFKNKSKQMDYICSKLYSLMGIIFFNKENYKESIYHFQQALSLNFKLRNYSPQTILILNNIGCLYYFLDQSQQALLYLQRGFRMGQNCVDYQLLMRSNMAMTLVEKGMIKEAKAEMYKTYKNIEPNSNMQIVCRFYSNLGYVELCDESFQKARNSFENACSIEQKCLIPNGYKPSIVLHNNFAMYHFKKKEIRKAAFHCDKIIKDLSSITGMMAVKIHFNISKINRQLYNYDIAFKHAQQARSLLMATNQKCIYLYKERIQAQISWIDSQKIDQVSEQSSYGARLSRLSKSLLSNKLSIYDK